jgi:CsoR family transcriptional regulator, copper-sensing transcriptional repressor
MVPPRTPSFARSLRSRRLLSASGSVPRPRMSGAATMLCDIPPWGIVHSAAVGHGYAENKEALVRRLHRIEGQVRGIERMVEDDRYCIDILTQISAVSTALESLALEILDDHVSHCVAGALASGEPAEANEKATELLDAVRRFTRSR